MALSISPSENWEGNDGPWSTFNVRVGTPLQQMQVLPASSQSAVFVVLGQGCPYPQDPANCPTLRGEIFNPEGSSQDLSWSPQYAPNGDPYFVLPFESERFLPNYTGANGEVGLDTLELDWNGKNVPSAPLQSQVIAGYAAPNPWLGMLGLSGRPSHIFNTTSSQNSPLQGLQTNKNIPSLYWAYTAGAQYATPPTFGSLTLGGYDTARVNMSSALSVTFGSDSTRDLFLAINSITIGGQSTINVPGVPIYTFIDSVVPDIWLPLEACQAFESALGLVWNETVSMYLVNDTQYATLVLQKPSVTFFLAATTGSPSGTSITLPYDAFDLTAQFPLAGIQDNTTSLRYFPLQRAANSSQYTLGRTFLQQAYLTADYDRGLFTVAPALFPTVQSTTDIVTVYPPGYHSGLKAGAIAGIAVGAVAAVALLAGLLFWLWRRRRQQHQKNETETLRTASIGDTTVVGDTEMADRGLGEYFKPPPADEDYFKPELDAYETATPGSGRQTERHELDAGSVRPGHRTGLSWGSAGSGVSPVGGDDRIRSMMGEPSPPIYSSASPSPPLTGRRHERHFSAGSPRGLFEMN